MVVAQPVQEGEIFRDIGGAWAAPLASPSRASFSRAMHGLPVAHRHRALREGVAQEAASVSRASPAMVLQIRAMTLVGGH